jgi:hypothetical protein
MYEFRDARAWWRTSALPCTLVAVALLLGARLAAGPKQADIHVEWRPFVGDAARQALESRFGLANPRKLEDPYSWRYTLTDASSRNIRALVTDPSVEDTHHIDRNSYTVAATAPRTPRRQRLPSAGDSIVGVADGIAIFLLVLAAVAYATRTPPLRALQRGIPKLDAAAAGLFRIVFGSLLLAFFAGNRIDSSRLIASADAQVLGAVHIAVLEWLRGHPLVIDLLTPWLLTTGLAFTVGVLTRVTYALFVAGVLVWAYVAVTVSGTHPHSPLVLSVIALLPSRWADARSVDSWLCRTRATTGAVQGAGASADRTYGYTVWIPGLIFGAAFAAAAWAKLSAPPGWTDWIVNGTVKYHFLGDSANAPVDWGVQLAAYPRLAILASLVAVATEALVVTASFIRNDWYRLAIGGAALALLSGFGLFMGVFWQGWWILLLGFLPWRRIARATAHQPAAISDLRERVHTARRLDGRLVTRLQLATIVAVLAQQFVVSSLAVERAPMFSWYPMYSGTYASPAEWNSKRPPLYRVIAATRRGSVELPRCKPNESFVREFETALKGSAEAKARVWRTLSGCGPDLSDVRSVVFEVNLRAFDWDHLVFRTTRSVTLGPLAAGEDVLP